MNQFTILVVGWLLNFSAWGLGLTGHREPALVLFTISLIFFLISGIMSWREINNN